MESVLSFAWANGVQRWKLVHLSFDEPMTDAFYEDLEGEVVQFMDDNGVTEVQTYVPEGTAEPHIQKFFDDFVAKKYWRLEPSDYLEQNDGWFLLLRKERALHG